MKKVISIMLTLTLLLSLAALAGCGSEEKNTKSPAESANTSVSGSEENNTKNPTSEGANASVSSAPSEPTVLKMGTNAYFKPYEYYEGTKITGIDVEIAEAIAAKLGMTLEIVDMEFDTIITAVNAGSVDFGMAGMTVTEDRLEEVDFSQSYANGVQVIIVKSGSSITSYDDLAAEGATYKVGVQNGTTGEIYATDEFGDARVTGYSTANEAVLALTGGSVDCVIIDNEPAKALVEANEGLTILATEYLSLIHI